MRRIIAFFSLCFLLGIAVATPRWGESFDWLGDTLQPRQPQAMIAFGDTVVFSSINNFYGYLQTGLQPDSFHQLFQISIPPTTFHSFNYCYSINHILRIGNRIQYGYPLGSIAWNGIESPLYQGASLVNSQFTNDEGFWGTSFSYGGDLSRFNYQNGSPHFRPICDHNFLFYRDSIFKQDNDGAYHEVASDTVVSEWVVRWPYAYNLHPNTHTGNVFYLDTLIPAVVGQFSTNRTGFIKIINDTMITVIGLFWECWSLTNPRQPVSLGIDTLTDHLIWLEDTPVDSLWFGWSFHRYTSPFHTDSTIFNLISFRNGVRNPIVVYNYQPPDLITSPNNGMVARTDYGWIVRSDASFESLSLRATSKIFSLQLRYTSLRQPYLDTLWYYRTPSIFKHTEYTSSEEVILGPVVSTERPRNESQILVDYYDSTMVFVMDTSGANHQIRWFLPKSAQYSGLQNILCDGENILFRKPNNMVVRYHWSDSLWMIDSLIREPNFLVYFHNDVFITQNQHSDTIHFYRITGNTAILESVIARSSNAIDFRCYRNDRCVVVENSTNLRLYTRQNNTWTRNPDFIIPTTLPEVYSRTTAQTDTLFDWNNSVYLLPDTGCPYLLIPTDTLLANNNTLGTMDFQRDLILIYWQGSNRLPTLYQYSNGTLINRGSFIDDYNLGAGDQNNLTYAYLNGNTIVFIGNSRISTYAIPPYDSSPEHDGSLLKSFELGNPYPNPFNPSTTITFALPKASNVKIEIYNVLGKRVKTVISSKYLAVGRYYARWNAQGFSSGVYFCRMEAGAFSSTKKLMLLK